jgi:hypothetical protein
MQLIGSDSGAIVCSIAVSLRAGADFSSVFINIVLYYAYRNRLSNG